jgi:hypothetical protein
MKNLLLIFLLLSLSFSAYSQRLLLASLSDSKIYAEESSIKYIGNLKSATLYYEFEEKKHGALSMVTENIYDCTQRKFKSKKLIMHELNEGQGNIIIANHNGDDEWIHPFLNTSGFDILKYICRNG